MGIELETLNLASGEIALLDGAYGVRVVQASGGTFKAEERAHPLYGPEQFTNSGEPWRTASLVAAGGPLVARIAWDAAAAESLNASGAGTAPSAGVDLLLDKVIAPNFNLSAASLAVISPDGSFQVVPSANFSAGSSLMGYPSFDVRRYRWVMLTVDAGQTPGSSSMAPRMAGRIGTGGLSDPVPTDDTGGVITNGSARQMSSIVMGQLGNSTAVQNSAANLQWKIQPVKSPFVSIALNWSAATNFQALATRVLLAGGY